MDTLFSFKRSKLLKADKASPLLLRLQEQQKKDIEKESNKFTEIKLLPLNLLPVEASIRGKAL